MLTHNKQAAERKVSSHFFPCLHAAACLECARSAKRGGGCPRKRRDVAQACCAACLFWKTSHLKIS